jgi:hypothetical protein
LRGSAGIGATIEEIIEETVKVGILLKTGIRWGGTARSAGHRSPFGFLLIQEAAELVVLTAFG